MVFSANERFFLINLSEISPTLYVEFLNSLFGDELYTSGFSTASQSSGRVLTGSQAKKLDQGPLKGMDGTLHIAHMERTENPSCL